MKKVDILAVGVHPDDVELSCAGTLLKHQDLGKTFGLLDLTRGELGTRGTPELRTQEANDAANWLGAAFRHQLNLGDGFFRHDRESIAQIATIIRACQPDVVLCNALSDRHPDHGRAAKLVADACFFSGLAKIETTFEGVLQTRWRPKNIYHYIQDHQLHPDFVVEITPYFDKKIETVLKFRSQFYDPNSTELNTPISGKDFLDFLKAKAQVFGRAAGVELGEGFNVARPPCVQNLFDLS